MNRAIFLFACFILIFSCAPKAETPERFMEDGAELEREFAIDTERDENDIIAVSDFGDKLVVFGRCHAAFSRTFCR